MHTLKIKIGVLLILLLLNGCKTETEIWYQGNNETLLTAQQLDSIVQSKNKIMQDKNLDMVFTKQITDSIVSADKIIYKYTLRGETPSVTKNSDKYEEMIGEPLPYFEYEDIDGNVITSKGLKGKPVVINMWFTKCPPCIAEMPALNQISEDTNNSDVQFIAMTYDNKETVETFLGKHNFNFKHITGVKAYCEKFTNQYPINIFVDRNGIINHIEGGMPLIYNREQRKVTDKVNPSNFISALKKII